MASKTVNEDLMIVTMGSKHLADTKTPADKCFLVDKKTIVPYRNYIPTADCDNAQATQKTLVRSFRIIHDKSKIGMDHGAKPSKDEPAFAGFGGGTVNGQVYWKEANDFPGSHSKNVKVEGKWIVRTDDQTQQNHRNCLGTFREGDGGITEDELEALLNKGCTLEAVITKCAHRDTAVDRISVLEGDTVTLEMNKHVNDAEVEPAARAKPVCQVPRRKAAGKLPADAKVHPSWRVTRSAYAATSWRPALPALTKEIQGLKITLAEEWLSKAKDKSKLTVNPDPKDKPKTIKDTGANFGNVTSANPVVDGARMTRDQRANPTSNPAAQARGEADQKAAAARDQELRAMRESFVGKSQDDVAKAKANAAAMEKASENTQSAMKAGAIVLTTWDGVKAIFYAKPVEVKVEALACAGAKVITVAAYPPESYSVNLLDLKEFKATFAAVRDTVSRVREFLRKIKHTGEQEEGAGASLAITAGRFKVAIWILKDAAVELGVEYRELERDAAGKEQIGRKKHEVFRAFFLDLKIERLIGIQFSYSIPIAFALGALGQFIQKLMDKLGTDLSIDFSVELSCGVSGRVEYDQYGKLTATKAQIAGVCKFTIALKGKAGSSASFSMSVTIEWKPVFELVPASDQPMGVKRIASTVDIKWAVSAAVNIFGWVVELKYGDTIWSGAVPAATYALS